MLRLMARVCRGDNCVDVLAIANSGFIGPGPEVALPRDLAGRLLAGVEATEAERLLADGSRARFKLYRDAAEVYVVTEDRVMGPVRASVYVTGHGTALLNDKLLGRLGIVMLDVGEGLWCFRDEVGYRVRRSL